MAGSLNRIMLIGRLTHDPELRYTSIGTAACHFAVATNRYGRNAAGETVEFTDYHEVVAWNNDDRKLADVCAQFLQRGRLVYVEGRSQTRSWDDAQTGQRRYRTEVYATSVQFLDNRTETGAPNLSEGGEELAEAPESDVS